MTSVPLSSGIGSSTTTSGPSPEAPDPSGPGIFNVKLVPYSAKGDGSTDDTMAIRSATSAACQAGGGEVYFPKGTYVISPQARDEVAALTVSCDGITMAGAGMGASVLSRKTLGDTDPDKTCPMSNGKVNRGYGIYVSHKSDGDRMRRSFHMKDLSLLGNRVAYTGIAGLNAWPASALNCFNVWDISDKGLFVDWDATDVQVLRSEIAYFSGELFYGGGQNSTNWVISGNNIHHGNGDGISISAGVDILNNQIHDLASNGIENQPFGAAEPQFFSGNNLYNIGLDGLTAILWAPSFYAAPSPKLEIAYNTVTNVHRYGVVMLSRAGSIHDNQIYDTGMPNMQGCGIAARGTQAPDGSWLIPQNLTVQHNTIEARTVTTQCGIWIYTAAQAGVTAYNVSITGNTLGPMKASADNAIHMLYGITVFDGAQQVTVQNNTLQ